jgi:hypothetical protein
MPKTVPHDSARKWRALTADAEGGRLLTAEIDGIEFALGGKFDCGKDDTSGLLVVKIWCDVEGAKHCNLLFIDLPFGGLIVASAQAATESKAWALCAEQARGRGYKV